MNRSCMIAQVVRRFEAEWPPPDPQHEQVVAFLTETYKRYCDEGLADSHFGSELANGPEYVYRQRVGELLLAEALWRDGFSLGSADEGPDFRAEKMERPSGLNSSRRSRPGFRKISCMACRVSIRFPMNRFCCAGPRQLPRKCANCLVAPSMARAISKRDW